MTDIPDTKNLTNNQKDINRDPLPLELKLLLRTTVRLFYSPASAIIYDLLLNKFPLSQIEMISLLKISYREFNRHIYPLKEDHLLLNESQITETRTNLYYYINPLECYNVIKYKMYKINSQLERRTNNLLETYRCNVCENEYSSLQALKLMKGFKFICCNEELKSVRDDFDYQMYTVFMRECSGIIKMLKELEGRSIESLDFQKALHYKNQKVEPDHSEKEGKQAIPQNSSMNINNISSMNSNSTIPSEDQDLLQEIENQEADEISDFSNDSQNSSNNKQKGKVLVLVNGVEKDIAEVTDEDQEIMTEKEYEAYFQMKERG